MSEDDIKPVAVLCDTEFGRYWSTNIAVKYLPLGDYYDQSAIDRLTDERDAARYDAGTNCGVIATLQQERLRLIEERDAAQMVCAEAYQVVASMLCDLDKFDTEIGEKILDNLSEHRLVHDDVLPWPSFEGEAQRKLSVAVAEVATLKNLLSAAMEKEQANG